MLRDIPHGPVVENSPSNAEDLGSVPLETHQQAPKLTRCN